MERHTGRRAQVQCKADGQSCFFDSEHAVLQWLVRTVSRAGESCLVKADCCGDSYSDNSERKCFERMRDGGIPP